MNHQIVVDEYISQMSVGDNENYEWIYKLMKCVAYDITKNLAYTETKSNTIVFEPHDKNSHHYTKSYWCIVYHGPYIKNMGDIRLNLNM